jgi:hypothetical protein
MSSTLVVEAPPVTSATKASRTADPRPFPELAPSRRARWARGLANDLHDFGKVADEVEGTLERNPRLRRILWLTVSVALAIVLSAAACVEAGMSLVGATAPSGLLNLLEPTVVRVIINLILTYPFFRWF